jgi:uncharacterized repeat protein (TIGR03803 family)
VNQNPSALFIDTSGNLYGTSGGSGVNDLGTIFELAAGSTSITALASFNYYGGPNGVIRDAAGNLFGTTGIGGPTNDGTVFELAAGTSTVTVLANFAESTTGGEPTGELVSDAAGNLLGTTVGGGTPGGGGTVFEVSGTGYVTSVPEPTNIAVLAVLGSGLLARRWRKH